jgi:3-oxoacyl-[acyl-carrier-protein] synthase-3
VLRCAPGVGPTDLAVAAGEQALAARDVAAAGLDLVVLAVADITEHLYWDAAASVTFRLGAIPAEAVLLTQACTTGVLGLDTMAGKLETHPQSDQELSPGDRIALVSLGCGMHWACTVIEV